MNLLLSHLLLPVCLLLACNQSTDPNDTSISLGPIEGTYEGYRSSFTSQAPPSDSIAIELKVSRKAGGKLEILQTSPNVFKYLVDAKDGRFTYDLGLGEAACGVTRITGEGYVKDDRLYLREKSECRNAQSAGVAFIQLRATKK